MDYHGISESKVGTIEKYLLKVLEANESINLTRVTDIEQARLLHLEDSLSILKEISESPDGAYADLGSGGGFPGAVLGIVTERETVLIDSVKKKMRVVQSILDEIPEAQTITTVDERIEEYSIENPEYFSVITARALCDLPSLLELSAPLLKKGGRLIAMKAKEADIETAKALENKLGMKLIDTREFYLSDDETYRRVFVFEKFKKPSIKLPRRTGLAQKKPLTP